MYFNTYLLERCVLKFQYLDWLGGSSKLNFWFQVLFFNSLLQRALACVTFPFLIGNLNKTVTIECNIDWNKYEYNDHDNNIIPPPLLLYNNAQPSIVTVLSCGKRYERLEESYIYINSNIYRVRGLVFSFTKMKWTISKG